MKLQLPSAAPKYDAPYQPDLRWWQSAWRYVFVFAIGSIGVSSTTVAATWGATDLVLGAVSLGLLHYRRRWPVGVAVLTGVFSVGSASSGAALLATTSVATRRRWREIVAVAAVAVAAGILNWNLVSEEASDGGGISDWTAYGFGTAVVLIAVLWGLFVGSRRELVWTLRERADRVEREQELRTEQARSAERAQIAREMHDVLAHRISQVSMQAGAIAFRSDLDADELRKAAGELQTSANAALVDLRGVLGVLRDPNSGARLEGPQPRFVDIDSLIEEFRSKGVRVNAEIDVDGEMSDTTGRTLYRLTQECLTNIAKHAHGVVATITIIGSPGAGVTFVANNPMPLGSETDQRFPRSGFGLIGLSERVALLGGSLRIDRPGGAFIVTCVLPWELPASNLPLEPAT